MRAALLCVYSEYTTKCMHARICVLKELICELSIVNFLQTSYSPLSRRIHNPTTQQTYFNEGKTQGMHTQEFYTHQQGAGF